MISKPLILRCMLACHFLLCAPGGLKRVQGPQILSRIYTCILGDCRADFQDLKTIWKPFGPRCTPAWSFPLEVPGASRAMGDWGKSCLGSDISSNTRLIPALISYIIWRPYENRQVPGVCWLNTLIVLFISLSRERAAELVRPLVFWGLFSFFNTGP